MPATDTILRTKSALDVSIFLKRHVTQCRRASFGRRCLTACGAEAEVPRVGRIAMRPSGYRAMLRFSLLGNPSWRVAQAFDRLCNKAVRLMTGFCVDEPVAYKQWNGVNHEDRAVREIPEFLAHGVAEVGWSVDFICAAHVLVVHGACGTEKLSAVIASHRVGSAKVLSRKRYVAASDDLLPQQLAELNAFFDNSNGSDPLLTAASALAQILSIHAFNDGNRRLGRVVALAVLLINGQLGEVLLNRCMRKDCGAHLRAIGAVQQSGDLKEWDALFERAIPGLVRI
jgi:hypothetical protein